MLTSGRGPVQPRNNAMKLGDDISLGNHHYPEYPSEIYALAAANAQQNPTDIALCIYLSVVGTWCTCTEVYVDRDCPVVRSSSSTPQPVNKARPWRSMTVPITPIVIVVCMHRICGRRNRTAWWALIVPCNCVLIPGYWWSARDRLSGLVPSNLASGGLDRR